MSGNSQDRRRFRRLVVSLFGFYPTRQQPPALEKQIWSWVTVGVAVPASWSIGAALMAAPLYVPDIFFVLGGVFLLTKFFTWTEFWREAKSAIKWRWSIVAIALAVVPTGLLIHANHVIPPFPFPWVSTANESGSEIGLQVIVRDHPLSSSLNTIGSNASLFHADILISRVTGVSKGGDSQRWDTVAHAKTDEIKNELGNSIVAWIAVEEKPVVLEIVGTTRDAHWEGYILLKREGKNVHRFEAMRGAVPFPRVEGKLERTEVVQILASGALSKCVSNDFAPLTKSRLLEYGVPEF